MPEPGGASTRLPKAIQGDGRCHRAPSERRRDRDRRV